jgi:hypothetical protein
MHLGHDISSSKVLGLPSDSSALQQKAAVDYLYSVKGHPRVFGSRSFLRNGF